jgi:MFS family permease
MVSVRFERLATKDIPMNSTYHRLFSGWRVVAAAALGLFWGVPIMVYSFTAFLKPLMKDFQAGRAAVSLAFTLQLIVGALSAPLAGWFIGRFGPRKVILTATAMFGTLLVFNRAFSGTLQHFYFLYAALGLLIHGMGPMPYGHVISHWFDRRRGLALGLMMAGIGCGAIIMPVLASGLIGRFGWHAAFTILGSLVLLIPIPVVAAVLKEKPQPLGLLPDEVRTGAAKLGIGLPGLSRHDASRSRTFWILVCAFSLVSVSVQGCLVHMAPMLIDDGLTTQTASAGASVMGAAVLLGRIGTGYLLDRFFASHVAALFFAGAAIGMFLLMTSRAPSVAFTGAFLVGLGLGAEVDMMAYLVSRYFGLRSFAEIYSLVFSAFALAGAFGPLLMGAGFDWTASYQVPLTVFLLATTLGAVLMTRLGPYRYRAGQDDETERISPLQVEESSIQALR